MLISLTVLFESPFWVAIIERWNGQEFRVARVVFGAEPTSAEVYDFLLREWPHLPFGPPHQAQENAVRAGNPKRLLREAQRFQDTPRMTRAQAALQVDLETRRREAKVVRREQCEEEQERRYQQRRLKAREKHRGH